MAALWCIVFAMNTDRPLRVLVVDDHPAVRAGVCALVEAEPGLVALEAVGDSFAVAPAVYAQRPDVVVLDYQLPGIDGLTLCRELRQGVLAPAVIIYSAFTERDMIVPAHVAGAGAIIDKATAPRELTLAIRQVASSASLLPTPTHAELSAVGHRLSAIEQALLALIVDGTPPGSIAIALGLDRRDIDTLIDGLLARLVVRGQFA